MQTFTPRPTTWLTLVAVALLAPIAVAADKPHGRREAYIRDPDGYIWVPDVPVA